MIYLDELIASHRKILRAGTLIGDAKGGAMAALGLFVTAIGYARSHLTDGIVPDEILANAAKNRTAINALREVRLIAPVRGSRWRINDYFAYNPTAEQVEQNRRLGKARQQKFRAKKGGANGSGNGVTETLRVRSTTHLSRVPMIHDPRSSTSTQIQDPPAPGASTVRSPAPPCDVPKREQRPAGRPVSASLALSFPQKHELAHAPAPDRNFAVLVRLTHEVMDAEHTDDPTSADVIEGVKVAAATRGIAYPPDVFNRALRSAGMQRVLNQPPTPDGPLGSMVDEVRTALANNTLPDTLRHISERRR